ncbi:reverse transcriptase domain-containing protein [Tanacetum coccineum]
MIFNIDYAMKHSYSNDDTCFSIDVIDEILEEYFDALLDEGSEILHSIEGTILKEKLFVEFDEFMAMTADDNSESESNTEEPSFEKITFNTDYNIKTSLEEPPMDLELKPLPDNLEYVFLEEPSFLSKGGITVVTNEKDELVPTRTVTGWGVCIDYRKLNEATAKDHFPLPFMDQMRMPFGLCNAPATFQWFMLAIFHDMIEESIETIVHTHHSALRRLFKKQDTKPCLIRWIMLLQEFDIEIKDIKGTENVTADHLSRIENDETSDDSKVDDNVPGETLMKIDTRDEPWFTDFTNYLVSDVIPKGMTYQQKNDFFSDLKHYFWEEPYLFKVCSEGMIRRCVSSPETHTILDQCHHGPTGGHYRPNTTAKKVLDSAFYWPIIIKEAHTQVRLCEACQKTGNISKREEMPLNSIQVCKIFDIWGIDFMGPFPKSYKFKYILVAVDYVSKWAEEQALPTNNARVVITFLKKLFYHFSMPKALISD